MDARAVLAYMSLLMPHQAAADGDEPFCVVEANIPNLEAT
jgi:hypothetical protein